VCLYRLPNQGGNDNAMQTPPASARPAWAASSKLLTADEVAEITGLSIETLAQWRSQGKGPLYLKISRNCVRYRQSDLDAWLVERIVRTDQDGSDRR
jgi:predicted DNA-binding transcriptional regulator AlpA